MSTTERHVQLDAEALAGRRFPYQEDISLVEDVDLLAATPGEDINWLEDVELLEEEGVPAVFDRYSNAFLRIYFPIPAGREDELSALIRAWSGAHMSECTAQIQKICPAPFASCDNGHIASSYERLGTLI